MAAASGEPVTVQPAPTERARMWPIDNPSDRKDRVVPATIFPTTLSRSVSGTRFVLVMNPFSV
jgi:hypothetical protein